MLKRLLTVLACLLFLSVASLAAAKKKSTMSGPSPDNAYLQKILDAWGTLDVSNVAPYYAHGDMLFFDISPLKYNSWAEYEKGAANLSKTYKSLKLAINDDAQLHSEGNLVWAAATVKEDAVTSSSKHEMATVRWTVILENQDGKWLIVHEHASEPLSQ